MWEMDLTEKSQEDIDTLDFDFFVCVKHANQADLMLFPWSIFNISV